jgi:hypothetical protein
VLSTAVSLQYVVKKPPQGYSNARLKEIYNRLEESIYAEAGNGQAYPVKSQAYPESPENPENRKKQSRPVQTGQPCAEPHTTQSWSTSIFMRYTAWQR